MPSSYIYTPLDPESSEIRLVTLEPGEWDDPISCTIHHAALDDKPAYEALSYVWGDANITEGISVQDQSFRITRNLYNAIRFLRLTESRVLWIDALCINQRDLSERSKQVPRMRMIYSCAAKVLSWLGEPTADSDIGMLSIKELAEVMERVESQAPLPGLWTPADDERLGFRLQERNWTAVSGILRREYWTRVWIFQELSSSGKYNRKEDRCIVGCGRIWIPKTIFYWFILLFICLTTSDSNFVTLPKELDEEFEVERIEYLEPIKSLRNSGIQNSHYMVFFSAQNEDETFDILDILLIGRKLSCTDPRDHVYGILGLSSSSIISAIAPDYTKTTEQVLVEVLTYEISRTNSLRCLRPGSLNPKCRNDKCPMWAMILSLEEAGTAFSPWIEEKYTSLYHAAGRKSISPTLDNSTYYLHCQGLVVGSVSKLTHPIDSGEFEKNFAVVQEIHLAYPDALWRALIMDREIKDVNDQKYPAPDYLKDVFENFISGKAAPESFQFPSSATSNRRDLAYIEQYTRLLERCVLHRCIFTTDTGYVGLGPHAMQAGDVVVVLLGSNFPFVCQPMEGRFGLVGDAYVQGIMNGELVFTDDGEDSPNLRNITLC